MRIFQFTSVKLTICLILGILPGFYLSINPVYPASVLLFALVGLGFYKTRQKRSTFPLFGILVALTVVCLGMLITILNKPIAHETHFSKHLTNENQRFKVKVKSVLKPTSFSERYVVAVHQCDSFNVTGKLLVNFPLDSIKTPLSVDDEFVFIGQPITVKPPLNPHQFDYKDYLEKQGIYHQIRLKKPAIPSISNPSKTLLGIASNFREGLINKLKAHNFGEVEVGIIQALLLGKRDDISNETYTDYKNAGAVHILAVSGLHIGILLLILQFLLKPLEAIRKGNQLKMMVILVALWSFALIAGLSPSVVRAVSMFSFLAYAMNRNRPTNTFNIIALSMFFILLVQPLFLFQVGFQMSYLAVIAIVWIYPKLQRFWYPENWFVRKVWQLLSVSLAAQLGVLPISLFYFHQFPSLFFISNLVVVPFLGVILGLGILTLLLSTINALPEFLVCAYNFLIAKMNAVIRWVANQEGFVFRDIPFDAVQMVLGYLLIFGLVLGLSRPKFKNIALFLGAIAGLLSWSIYNQYGLKAEERLLLLHQTGNSVLLHQKNHCLRVFTSNNGFSERTVNDFKVAERIASVDFDSLRNSYQFNEKSIFIMDGTGIHPREKRPGYLLLTQSPKINLERLLDTIRPNTIVADGSNYKSYIDRWKETCRKRKIPFHYTGEKGAFYFGLNE